MVLQLHTTSEEWSFCGRLLIEDRGEASSIDSTASLFRGPRLLRVSVTPVL